MTQRALGTRDLLFGLIAVKRGLIDEAQLVAALETWINTQEGTLGAMLRERGNLNESDCALVEDLVAGQLDKQTGAPARAPASPREVSDPGVDELPRPFEPGLSATVAYIGRADSAEGLGGATAAPTRYQIIRHHARGGLGEISIAVDPDLERQVAFKELRAFHADDPTSQSRFLLEAKLTGRLEHPGIVPVYGFGRHADGRPYYAMRFIEGQTLQQAIDRFHAAESTANPPGERELAFRRLLGSLIDSCNAVAYAHSRGVVHRDLKPENIMLGPFGETIVLDWGIAKPRGETGASPGEERSLGNLGDDSLTRPGSAIGTPRYMSPEQAEGDLDRVGPASDVYSLGATLYCILVGHGPFSTGGVVDVLERVRRGIFLAPRRVRRSIDPALEAICLKAMALQPTERHASPLVLAEEIEAWLANIRYQGEQARALNDVKRSLVRLCIERAQNLFGREMPGEGRMWLGRALENLAPDSPALERVVRTSLAAWHAAGKQIERTLCHGGKITAVEFSPDGRRLASASADRTVRLWDIAKGDPLSAPMPHEHTIRAMAFSPDGRVVATACDDGAVMMWDGVTGAACYEPMRHGGPVTAIRFSPDGLKIATAGTGAIDCLRDAATGQPIGGMSGREADVRAIAFHPDGSRLAGAGEDGRVWLRDTETGRLSGGRLEHDAVVTALAFSPDGRCLFTDCRDGRARIWLVERGAIRYTFPSRAEACCAAFSPTSRSIALVGPDGTARLWNVETGRPIGEPLVHRGRVDCVAFNHHGTIVATGSPDGMVRLWDADTGLPLGPPLSHKGAVAALAFSPDSRRLSTACSDGLVRCWRMPAPIVGDVERVSCWLRVTTELEFDDGDAIRPMDQLTLWELRRRLQELGGAPVR